ncbi:MULTISPECIES: FTR1 family protein [unclassified Beijerinckia]|uniref:FTR1 family iron permease n=1 Tax=unclassified Beijerinckia TaxID=2638183 RepID=UPI00089477A4|nr:MULTISPECIES: FTR1 family protein [unclassified Beijerinckia]MDH7798464.1 high-affinity iron transporter [Beijerinckia sp. GAS462]SED21764.1 high-affinity iron transporter [Beijerinckia sp. 28-YEA-48]
MKLALESGLILLREGLEALLIVTALAAAMRRAGAHERLRPLYIGAVLAILASLVAAWIFQIYFDGTHDDRIEAVVLVIAAILMLYMSGWLFLRQDPKKWKAEMARLSGDALTAGTGFSLGLISFLAVFREGAETVLFLYALASTSGGWSAELILGLVVAAAALVAIYIAMQWLAMQIPIRPLFIITSAFLFIMGLRFVGAAIQELQEQTIVPYDLSPAPDWLVSIAGNPTWEALGAQLAIALIALAGIFTMRGKVQPATTG